METKEDVQADIDRMLDGRSIEDIERELDRQIAEQNALPEPVESTAEATQPESYSTLNSVQESAEENQQKLLTTTGNSDIINERERETEYGYQYGEGSINVDWEYINSDEYAKRFDNITDNPAVNNSLLECSREALRENDGTKHEYLYIIDANTGKVLGSCFDTPGESGIVYNEEIKKVIASAKEAKIPIIGLHNHPEGAPPSVDDFNKAHENGYVFGFIPGHNGQLYMYSNPGKTIDKEDVETIHFNIGLLCREGADPDRIYKAEYAPLGLEYQIIGR